MPLSVVGSLIKRHAPPQLKQNQIAIKLFDAIFQNGTGKSDSPPMKRRYYMTLNQSVLEKLERDRPALLILTVGPLNEGGIEHFQMQFEQKSIPTLAVELSVACSSRLDTAAILADPMPLRAVLLQLNRICRTAGCKLILAENTSNGPLSQFLASLAHALEVNFVRVRVAFHSVSELSGDDAERDTYVSFSSELFESSLQSIDDDFLRGIQFATGLRSTRNCFILLSQGLGIRHRKEWNDIIIRLIADCEESNANLIVVEDEYENALNTKTYDRILKSDKAALFPGKICDTDMQRRLLFSSRSICFGKWVLDVKKRGRGLATELLSRSRKNLGWIADNKDALLSANSTVVANLSAPDRLEASSWDLGMSYGAKLVDGQLKGPLALAQSDTSTEVTNGVQKYLTHAFGAPWRVDGANKISKMVSVSGSSAFLQWGASDSTRRRNLRRNGKIAGAPFFFIEDGFIRSITIGLTGSPGLSFLVDDLGPYYDARQWSRLELALASEWVIDPLDRQYAADAMSLIREKRISKYNHAPDHPPAWAHSRNYTILLVDQRVGDQSVPSGLATEHSFRQMVIDAVEQPGNPLVILKRHPDGTLGGKGSYFSRDVLGSLLDNPSIILEDLEFNPYALFDVVDEVYCVTSGMGFEALIAGKAVKTYGAPFYAGWGLTNDHLKLDWRGKRRSLEDLFYWAYMARAVYYDPAQKSRTDVEGLCSFIERARTTSLDNSEW